MSVRGLRRLWIVASVSLFSAAHSAAADAPGAATEDPLVAAKREYEALKAATTGAEQQKLLVPPTGLPQLEVKPEAPAVLSPLARSRAHDLEQNKTAAKGRNWLVDAMNENTSARSGTATKTPGTAFLDASRGDSATATDAFTALRMSRRPDLAAAPRQVPDLSRVANPLTHYMGAWMTAGDHALLVPRQDAANEFSESGSPVRPSGGNVSTEPMTNSRSHAPSLLPGGVAANPYLVELDVAPKPAPDVRSILPTDLPSLTVTGETGLPRVTGSAPTSQTAPPSIAEALKPNPDAKYFKQLKRF